MGAPFAWSAATTANNPKKKRRKRKVTTQIRDQLKIGRTTIDNSILCTLLCCQQLSLSISRSWWFYSLSMVHLVFKWIYCLQIDCVVWLAVYALFSLSRFPSSCWSWTSFLYVFCSLPLCIFYCVRSVELPHCQNYTIIYLANGIFLFQMRWCKLVSHQNIHSINSFSEFLFSVSISTFWHCIFCHKFVCFWADVTRI